MADSTSALRFYGIARNYLLFGALDNGEMIMKISELVLELQSYLAFFGDLPVVRSEVEGESSGDKEIKYVDISTEDKRVIIT